MSKVISLLIVDDHSLFREGLTSVFNRQPDFNVVGEAGTIRETLACIAEKCPDLILMDVGLPDGDGIDAIEQILAIRKDIWIVFLTVHESEELAFTALRRGAKGYLTKDINPQKLIVALRAIERGELAISRELSSRYIEETSRWFRSRISSGYRDTGLTAREVEVLAEISAGQDNRAIAQRLNISLNTVKVHVNNILHKLGISTRKELMEYARRQGIL